MLFILKIKYIIYHLKIIESKQNIGSCTVFNICIKKYQKKKENHNFKNRIKNLLERTEKLSIKF